MGAQLRAWACLQAGVLRGDEPLCTPLRPYRHLRLRGLSRGLWGAGWERALRGVPVPLHGEVPTPGRVPGSPARHPFQVGSDRSQGALPGPARSGRLGGSPVRSGPGSSGSAQSTRAPPAASQSSSGAAGSGAPARTLVAGGPRRSRPGRGASAPAHPAHSRGNCNSSGFLFCFVFFRGAFYPTAFVLSRLGGQSGVQESKHETNPEGVGRRGRRGREARRAGSGAPARACASRPAPPRPRVAQRAVSCCTGTR